MKKQLLLFVSMLLPLVASADAVEIDGIYYNLVSEGQQAEVTSNPSEYYSNDITIPESVKNNGITYSVTSIGYRAFLNCSGLTSVTIGNGIKSIGNNAFYRCKQLTDFYCFAESVPTTGSDVFYDSNLDHATLHVPASSVNLYSNTEPWSGFSEIIEAQEKCATPTISFKNGKTYFECETPDVTYHYSITSPKIVTNLGDDVKVDLSYSLQVYASKDGYLDSDTATQDIDVRGLKGDVNDDGDITAQDASLILQKVAGKINW